MRQHLEPSSSCVLQEEKQGSKVNPDWKTFNPVVGYEKIAKDFMVEKRKPNKSKDFSLYFFTLSSVSHSLSACFKAQSRS